MSLFKNKKHSICLVKNKFCQSVNNIYTHFLLVSNMIMNNYDKCNYNIELIKSYYFETNFLSPLNPFINNFFNVNWHWSLNLNYLLINNLNDLWPM